MLTLRIARLLAKHNGVKVDVHVNRDFSSLSSTGFPYHIHEAPVSGNDCMSTKKHLDNFKRNPDGSNYKCDPKVPHMCEQGDLSGKYSVLNGTITHITYVDSNLPHVKALYGETSVVVHLPDKNKTRLACATISKKP
ncbi:Cell surface superoxide dismutase [Cu-Zn] 4 [Massospora cicadina]|nr:Cell surface superoxide dismutase [Cu-Zn] 4 [Massospora cicadina]